MLDIRIIRNEPERVKAELAKVGVEAAQVQQPVGLVHVGGA